VTASVLGLDLSLTSTGTAISTGSSYDTNRIRPPGGFRGHLRLSWLADKIAGIARGIPLVVVEGPAFGAKGDAYHQLAGLWWVITLRLWDDGIPTAVVPPAALKRYATGKGNAGKDDVLRETCRRFPTFGGGNDEADALWLAAMGADHLGHPLTPMPATHRAALAGVDWPALPALEAQP
jgi:crossover junction endodeoxyribonuclease RuvC